MKLYKTMLNKIYETALTRKELDSLLFLLQVQDDMGCILNVHWSELAAKVGMVSQTFYNCIKGLKEKGFISVHSTCPRGSRNGRGMRTIRVLVGVADKAIDGGSSDSKAIDGRAVQDAIQDALSKGIITQTELISHIKACGAYLNLNNYSLVNTAAFRKLKAEEKKIVLTLLWRHQTTMGLRRKKSIQAHDVQKVIRAYDVRLTQEAAAGLLGFPWRKGRAGVVVRRKIKRYFGGVMASGLLPVSRDCDFALRWAVEDMGRELPAKPVDTGAGFGASSGTGKDAAGAGFGATGAGLGIGGGKEVGHGASADAGSAKVGHRTGSDACSAGNNSGLSTSDSISDSISDKVNRRIINIMLAQKGVSASFQDIQDCLRLFDEQFRGVTGLKMLAVAVRDVVAACIKEYATLVPAFVNVECRKVLAAGAS